MKFTLEDYVQRDFHYAIVDEVDSILVDEARTPLIISGPSEESTDKYYRINQIIPGIRKEKDYTIDEKARTVVLTEEGVARVEKALKVENLFDPRNIELAPSCEPGPEGPHPLQARRGLCREGRRGAHRRRVHGPSHAGAALQRGAAPGPGSKGKRQDRAGKPDAGLRHLPELLPDVREARRDDRHGRHGSGRVQGDLRPRSHGDPHEHAHDPDGSRRRDLPDGEGEVRCRHRGDQRAAQTGAARACRHHLHRAFGEAEHHALPDGGQASRSQCKAPRARGGDHQPGRAAGRRHHLDEHGRPRHGHQAGGRGRAAGRPAHPRHGDGTRAAGSTTSSGGDRGARAMRGLRGSTFPWTTICCGSSAASASSPSWSASGSRKDSRSRPTC